MHAFAGAPCCTGGKEFLDPAEDLGNDERFVGAGVLDGVPLHHADVDRVGEDLGEALPGEGAAGLPRWPRLVRPWWAQFPCQTLQRPVAGGVVVEGAGDERCSLRIGDDAGDLATAHDLAQVEIAERGAVGEAAQLHLLVEALLDLVGQVGRVELGHQRVDALDQPSRSGLFDVLGHRDKRHAAAPEQRPDGHMVLHVAGEAVDLVDHDGLDVAVLGDAGQHGLQGRPIRAASRLTPVDVLVGEQPPAVADRAGAGLALGRDREAFLPLPFLGLLAGGHPQVDHTAHRITLLRSQSVLQVSIWGRLQAGRHPAAAVGSLARRRAASATLATDAAGRGQLANSSSRSRVRSASRGAQMAVSGRWAADLVVVAMASPLSASAALTPRSRRGPGTGGKKHAPQSCTSTHRVGVHYWRGCSGPDVR